jgi:hypothetical protein
MNAVISSVNGGELVRGGVIASPGDCGRGCRLVGGSETTGGICRARSQWNGNNSSWEGHGGIPDNDC